MRSTVSSSSNLSNDLRIIYPNGGETLSGEVTLRWSLDMGDSNDTVWFSVHYSPDNGQNWVLLAPFVHTTSSKWDTTLYQTHGTKCLIKVIAESKEGLYEEAISASSFVIDNRERSLPFGYPELLIPLGSIIVVSSTGAGYYFYKTKLKQQSFAGLFQTNKIEFLKGINHKIVIGLDNIKSGFIDESPSIPALPSPRIPPASMVDYFPSDIKYELRSEIKGRTVLTLIEIAYQDPSDTNPGKLAESLNIPLPTLSKDIKRLKELDYIETHVSTQVIQDGRFKNFKITLKGYKFLLILNTALKVTINRLKRNGTFE